MDRDIRLENAHIMFGDALTRLKELPDNSVDSIVTDPPYGLSDNKYVADTIAKWIQGERDFIPDGKGFMGKAWDAFVPPPAIWDECLRVLKPGGHLLAFFGTRTQDIGALAIRLAGFEIRDSVAWLYGSGFPKSLDISKAIDKQAGAEREVVSRNPNSRENATKDNTLYESGTVGKTDYITDPATPAAKQYEGWGTALKPAHEPIVVARKPISEKTVANNVLHWGTGGLNIDASRVGFVSEADYKESTQKNQHGDFGTKPMEGNNTYGDWSMVEPKNYQPTGRFPANLILSHSEDCVDTGETTMVKSNGHWAKTKVTGFGDFGNGSSFYEGVGHKPGEESAPVYRCVPGCPVAELDRQSGNVKGGVWNNTAGARHFNNDGEATDYQTKKKDETVGGASRFFYVAKANKKDRNEGMVDMNNTHPTVKPTALMEYLVRLVTPEGGTVLDPFTGSGSTGKAAILGGFKFIGCELTEDYLPIIEGRLRFAEAKLTDPEPKPKKTVRKKKTKEEPNDTLF